MSIMIPVAPVYETEFVSIEVNNDLKYVQVTWHQQPSSALFRKETMRVVDLAMEQGYQKSLFDVRNRHYLDMGDQNWLVRDVFPMFDTHKIRLAYLVSTVGLEIMDTFKIHDQVIHNPELKKHIDIDIFLDREDALKWVFKPLVTPVP